MMNLQSGGGEVSYSRFDPQTKSRRKVIIGCTILLLGAGLIALICVLATPSSSSDGGSEPAETGYFEHELFTDTNEKAASIETERAVTTQTPDYRDLFRTSEPIVLTYEITNKYKTAKTIAIRDTPLESGEVLTNFLSHLPDVYFAGDLTENTGTMYDTIVLQPDETRRVSVDLDKNVLFAKFGEVPISLSYTLYMPTEEGQDLNQKDVPKVLATTSEVLLTVTKGAGIQIDPPEPTQAPTTADGRRELNVFVGADGIPVYTADCIDDPTKTGYTYTGSGQAVPCNNLRNHCDSSAVARWCPSACGTCSAIENSFTHPATDKSRTVGHVSGTSKESCQTRVTGADGRTMSEMDWIREAETTKHSFCATMLWHLQSRSSQLVTNFREWFGDYDETRWQKVRDGFAKICSADSYRFNCNPSAGLANDRCGITFEWGGKRYTNWKQQQMVDQGIKQDFIDKCNSPTKCTFSGTIAWVSSGDAYNRVINICPIGFWIQENGRSLDFSSRASVIIHELSHFVDMADTTDYSYDKTEMRNWAAAMSKDMIKNAASWDNFSEDPDFSIKDWNDFGGGGSSTGSASSTGSSTGSSGTGSSTGSTTSGSSSGTGSSGDNGDAGNGSRFFEMIGDCDTSNDCVSSKNYPNKHGDDESCTVTMAKDADVIVGSTFQLETCCDNLHIKGVDTESSSAVPSSLKAGDTITWKSDGSVSKNGWQFCFKESSSGGSSGGGSSGGGGGGSSKPTGSYSMKSSVWNAKCRTSSSKTKSLPNVGQGDWQACGSAALHDDDCGHMFYTNAHPDGTSCRCVREGEICEKQDDSDWIIFVIVADGACTDHTWRDADGSACSAYVEHGNCEKGSVLKDVENACGNNQSCRNDGMFASDACCECGGGFRQ